MAFAFWRCCSEFSVSPAEMMQMPLTLFWSMCRFTERIRAEKDLRLLNIAIAAAAAGQGETSLLKEIRAQLTSSLGVTVRMKEEVTSKEDIMKILGG